MALPAFYSSNFFVEHLAIREKSGITDMSGIRKVWVSGPDAQTFINRNITRDCDVIRHGFSAYTTLLNDEGSVVDDAIVFRMRADDLSDVKAEWLLCLGAGQGLNLLIESAKNHDAYVSVDDFLHCVLIQGATAFDEVTSALEIPELNEMKRFQHKWVEFSNCKFMVSRTTFSGEDGFEIFGDEDGIKKIWSLFTTIPGKRILPVGFNALNIARIEAGLLFYGQDMTGVETPNELGLDFVVDLKKECFRGKKSLINRLDSPRITLVGVETNGHHKFYEEITLYFKKSPVGKVKCLVFSTWLNKTIGFAHINPAFAHFGGVLEAFATHNPKKSVQFKISSRYFYNRLKNSL